MLVLSVDHTLGSRGQASFVVPEGTPGISQGQKFKKMGIRASHTAEVVLEDCRVPGRCLLGGKEKLDERLARAKEGKKTSTQAAMATFEASRPIVGAQAVGIARAAYEYSLDYAKERKQFGRAIIENQAIAFKLADMKMRTDAARLLVQRAAWMASTGKKFENGEGSMSKLFAGETAVWVTEQAIQILGGYGYVRDYPVERWHRDSKIYTIFEGTSEIQRLVISPGHLGDPHQLVDLGFYSLTSRNSLARVRKRAARRCSESAPSKPKRLVDEDGGNSISRDRVVDDQNVVDSAGNAIRLSCPPVLEWERVFEDSPDPGIEVGNDLLTSDNEDDVFGSRHDGTQLASTRGRNE